MARSASQQPEGAGGRRSESVVVPCGWYRLLAATLRTATLNSRNQPKFANQQSKSCEYI